MRSKRLIHGLFAHRTRSTVGVWMDFECLRPFLGCEEERKGILSAAGEALDKFEKKKQARSRLLELERVSFRP